MSGEYPDEPWVSCPAGCLPDQCTNACAIANAIVRTTAPLSEHADLSSDADGAIEWLEWLRQHPEIYEGVDEKDWTTKYSWDEASVSDYSDYSDYSFAPSTHPSSPTHPSAHPSSPTHPSSSAPLVLPSSPGPNQ